MGIVVGVAVGISTTATETGVMNSCGVAVGTVSTTWATSVGGGMFVAAVERFDNDCSNENVVTNGRDIPVDHIREFLGHIFTDQMMAEIEGAFESSTVGCSKSNTKRNEFDYSTSNGIPYISAEASIRMAMIMRNIISNGGDFHPEKFMNRMKKQGYDKKL